MNKFMCNLKKCLRNKSLKYSKGLIGAKYEMKIIYIFTMSVFITFFIFISSIKAQNINESVLNNEIASEFNSIVTPKNESVFSTLNDMIEVGYAKFSFLFFDIYESRLFTNTGLYETGMTPLIFEIKYLKNINSDDLVNKTIEQWQHLNINESEYITYVSWLFDLWPDIRDGDKLSLLIIKDKSVFYFNDDYLGEITDVNFGPLFLDIWLSPNTSQPKLRKKLLNL